MRLELQDVHAHYGKSHILHGVDLAVEGGEIVCLLGRNGVGKSTTLKSIIGLVRPSRGVVQFGERRIESLAAHRIAKMGIGYVPEERRIFPTITVRENLIIAARPPLSGLAPWSLERIFQFFPRLAERQNQRAGTLSGGEQQMLTIGRTLMTNPELILIDEPTEGLAPIMVAEIERMLAEIGRSGAMVILVEQGIEFALNLAQRAYVMSKGKIVFGGSVAELRAAEDVRRQYLEV
jgi:branched-chain amino acid transport system ATP-binding protein